jgi:hypothetical protein
MTFVGYRTSGTVDRRIGRRARIGGLDVTWVIPRRGAWSLRRSPIEAVGRVENVSLTGAAITAPGDAPLELGETLIIRFQGFENSVVIRRIQATDDPSVVRVGVELVVVHPELKHRITQAVVESSRRAD